MGVFGYVKGLVWNRPERRFRAPWRILAGLGMALVLFSAIYSVGDAVYGSITLTSPGAAAVWEMGLFSVGILALTAAVVGISWLLDKRRIADLGLRFDHQWWADGAVGLVVGAVMALIAVGLLVTLGGRVTDYLVTRPGDFALPAVSPILGVGLFVAFFGAFAALEEVVVRGYLLVNVAEGLAGYVGSPARAAWASVGITALLFGWLHAANPSGTVLGMLVVTAYGALLGAAVVLTGRLSLSIGLHAAWNVTVGPIFGLPVSGLTTEVALVVVSPDGSAALTGGSFGPEGGLVALAALPVGAALLGLWVYRRNGDLAVPETISQPDIWDVRMPEE